MTNIKIVESIVVIVAYILLRIISNKLIDRTMVNKIVQKPRGKIIKKIINLLLLSICSAIVLVIWGVDQSEIVVFMGSILAVIGVALFAQWSILSNITSGIIIFFNHNVKLEDTIVIMDKDFSIEGRVSEVGLFFVIVKTTDGEKVSIPNNVFIQKMIKTKIDD